MQLANTVTSLLKFYVGELKLERIYPAALRCNPKAKNCYPILCINWTTAKFYRAIYIYSTGYKRNEERQPYS